MELLLFLLVEAVVPGPLILSNLKMWGQEAYILYVTTVNDSERGQILLLPFDV